MWPLMRNPSLLQAALAASEPSSIEISSVLNDFSPLSTSTPRTEPC